MNSDKGHCLNFSLPFGPLHDKLSVTILDKEIAMKFRCVLCGYEYEGDSLPEDFVCPVCGAGPEDFEVVEE